jgi:hypothetical protein
MPEWAPHPKTTLKSASLGPGELTMGTN